MRIPLRPWNRHRNYAGLSAPVGENQPGSGDADGLGSAHSRFIPNSTLRRTGTCLAATHTSVVVFRATVLSIVVIFAAGPTASLMCKAWCEPQAAAARGCYHQDDPSSTGAAGSHSCQDAVQGSNAVVKEVRIYVEGGGDYSIKWTFNAK